MLPGYVSDASGRDERQAEAVPVGHRGDRRDLRDHAQDLAAAVRRVLHVARVRVDGGQRGAGSDRPEDAPEPLLRRAALLRLRHREAGSQACFRGDEGRGRLGRRLHRVRRVSVDRTTGRTSRRASGTRTTSNLALMCEEVHATTRSPASSSPTAAGTAHGARPASRGRALPARERLRPVRRPQGDGARRHPPHPGRVGARRAARPATSASTSSTSTAATATCRCSSSRPSTTSAPTSTAARSRTAPASGWRRSRPCARRSATSARSPSASASTRSGRPASSWRRASSSSAWPTTSSTSGT